VIRGKKREIYARRPCVRFSSVGLWEGFLGDKITRSPFLVCNQREGSCCCDGDGAGGGAGWSCCCVIRGVVGACGEAG